MLLKRLSLALYNSNHEEGFFHAEGYAVKRTLAFGLPLLLLAASCYAATPTFQHEVLPLLEKKCLGCHGGGRTAMAGLDLRTLESVMAGGNGGPVVVPGNPDGSKFFLLVRDGKMPMGG